MLAELITRLRSGEFTLDEFATAAAGAFVRSKQPTYPETDGNEAVLTGVSTVTISQARHDGLLTQDEVEAIYAALPRTGT
jgi:hypothetical protein